MTATLYSHTQPGTLMRAILGSVALAAFGALVFFGLRPEPVGLVASGATCLVMVVCLMLFHSLTVAVTDEAVQISFGPGLIRRSFRLSDIVSCAAVRNSWVYGWGIHMMRGGWVYNVSGFDAVELTFKDGRKARIGTDEPHKLSEAIVERVQPRGAAGR
jgi:hypothetical protein